MPVSSGRRRPSFPPPCQRRPPRQCCSRCPERPFPSSSGPPSARPASFSSSAAGCWNPARPSTRPPRLCGRETPLSGTGRPPRQRPRRSPWPSCHASTRCRPRPASPRSSWRSPGRTCPSYEACPPSRPGPEAVSVCGASEPVPRLAGGLEVGRARPPPPREFTYLLLLLSLHALAVPELAPGVLDLSRRGVSQNSSFIRTNCRGQSRRLPREGRGLTFPESTKYFAGTISASLSRNRLQTSAPESVMAPPVNSSITPPSLSLSLSRSIAAAELVGDLELLFSPRACAQPSWIDRSIWYNDETRERVDRSRDGARLHGRGLRDFGRKFAIGCVLLPQARRRSPRFLGGRRAVRWVVEARPPGRR